MTRRWFAILLAAWVVAYGGGSLAFTAGAAQAQCVPQSSAGQTYGGQGTQITGVACPSTGEPSSAAATPSPGTTSPTSAGSATSATGSALPFTGLDLGLLVGAALILIAGGTVLRLRLRHWRR